MKRKGDSFRLLLFAGMALFLGSCIKKQEVFFPTGQDNGCGIPIVLSDQTAVDNFSGKNVFGHLIISGSGITDLGGLGELEYICGNLEISFCQNLANLEGLPTNLVIDGDLIISGNRNLISLNGLPTFLTVNRNLRISLNDGLKNVQGIPFGLEVKGKISINNNNALESLKGFPGSLMLNKLEIIFNSRFSTLEGIPPHVTTLIIGNNPVLPDLKGLPIGFYCQELEIFQCNGLLNLHGYYPSNASMLSLILEDNALLNDVQELEALNNVRRKFFVANNPSLGTCCGMFQLLDARGIVPQEIRIKNNKEGCNNHSEVLNGGGC